jgi:hypothetical protein
VSVNEQGFVLVLVAVLLGLAGYFGWQQLRTLRGLTAPDVLGANDSRFLKAQAGRRLTSSILMAVFACFLIGWLFLDSSYQQLQEELRLARVSDPGALPTDDQKEVLRFFSFYWIGALLVLMALLALAAADFWATARFGLSQHRKLQADHRAQLQQQVNQLRQDRNGQQKH